MRFRRRSKPGASPNLEGRTAVYDRLFGEAGDIYHERLPLVPHIDVHTYLASRDRPFVTLITGGMSDLPMPGAPRDCRRAELVLYVDAARAADLEMLRALAHYPFDQQTWIGLGHTADYGEPDPRFPTLDALLFFIPPVEPDASLEEHLSIGGDPVQLLWVVPLAGSELRVKLDHGIEALADLLDDNNHPIVFERARRPYV